MVMVIGAILLISIASTTKEGRQKARDDMRRWAAIGWAAAIAVWGFIAAALIIG